MTEFSEKVDRQKLKLEAEEWGKQLKYYHFNNGVRTIEFNNGYKTIENTNTDRVKVEKYDGRESLLDRFLTAAGRSWK